MHKPSFRDELRHPACPITDTCPHLNPCISFPKRARTCRKFISTNATFTEGFNSSPIFSNFVNVAADANYVYMNATCFFMLRIPDVSRSPIDSPRVEVEIKMYTGAGRWFVPAKTPVAAGPQ